MKTKDEVLLKEAVQILQEEGSIEYAVNAAKQIMDRAWKDIEGSLPEGQAKDDLYDFSQYLIKRSL